MINLDRYSVIISAPFGSVGVVLKNKKVYEVSFLPNLGIKRDGNDVVAQEVSRQIHAYFMNSSMKLDFPVADLGTSFQKRVWKEMRNIPAGKTLTYGELAKKIGTSPRAIGNACAKNPLVLYYPCHRIVAKNSIGGFSGETDATGFFLNIKYWLLSHENGWKN